MHGMMAPHTNELVLIFNDGEETVIYDPESTEKFIRGI